MNLLTTVLLVRLVEFHVSTSWEIGLWRVPNLAWMGPFYQGRVYLPTGIPGLRSVLSRSSVSGSLTVEICSPRRLGFERDLCPSCVRMYILGLATQSRRSRARRGPAQARQCYNPSFAISSCSASSHLSRDSFSIGNQHVASHLPWRHLHVYTYNISGRLASFSP